jgi:hypothetical protein
MPGSLVHENATVNCPHGGQAKITSKNKRVTVGGQAVALASDMTSVSGCPFQVPIGTGTKPQPCVTVQWAQPATRVKVTGEAVLLSTSKGACKSAEQAPQGPPSVGATQVRVSGK